MRKIMEFRSLIIIAIIESMKVGEICRETGK
jgi:hypothetical protein